MIDPKEWHRDSCRRALQPGTFRHVECTCDPQRQALAEALREKDRYRGLILWLEGRLVDAGDEEGLNVAREKLDEIRKTDRPAGSGTRNRRLAGAEGGEVSVYQELIERLGLHEDSPCYCEDLDEDVRPCNVCYAQSLSRIDARLTNLEEGAIEAGWLDYGWIGTPQALAEALGGWRPIETAPRDGTMVLLAAGGRVLSGRFKGDYLVWYVGGMLAIEDPTHWQPLPDPPEEV